MVLDLGIGFMGEVLLLENWILIAVLTEQLKLMRFLANAYVRLFGEIIREAIM